MHKGQILYAPSNRRKHPENLQKNVPKEVTIYDEVQRDMSPQFLSYINELVKPVKMPKAISKKQTQQDNVIQRDNNDKKNDRLLDSNSNGQQTGRSIENLSIEQIPVKLNKIELSAKDDIKNSIRYLDDLNLSMKMRKQSSIDRVIQNQKKEKSFFYVQDNKSFLQGMDRYVKNLERQSQQRQNQVKQQKQWQRKKHSKQPSVGIFKSNQKAKLQELSDILEQNSILQSRVKIYEQRFENIKGAVYMMIEHFQTKEKQLNKEIKSLNKALNSAVDKMNLQQEEIVELQTFYKDFQNQLEIYNNQKFNNQTMNLFQKKSKQRERQKEIIKERQAQRFTKLKTEYPGIRDFYQLKTEEFQVRSPAEDRFPSDRYQYDLRTPSTFQQSRPKTNSCVLPTKNHKLINNTKYSKELALKDNKHQFKYKSRKGSEVIDFQY